MTDEQIEELRTKFGWGIPVVDDGRAEVIAWMEDIDPEPYQKEGEMHE